MNQNLKITALAGGVGGAKLAEGLSQCLPPENLTILVNTGDDFTHWGLNISPDLDTVCYTLAGMSNPETGWGRREESWHVFENMQKLGGADWFRLGDQDIATHLERTRRLQAGEPLSSITRDFCKRWGIGPLVLPMSDEPVSTIVDTLEYGELAFQEYFVHQRCAPTVKGFRFDGLDTALPAPGAAEALLASDAIIFCPSNPWVSIDPILRVWERAGLQIAPRAVIAVSPIIGGETVKGPAAKMFQELGIKPSALAVARHYGSLLTGFALDEVDADMAEAVRAQGIEPLIKNTLMKSPEDRKRLAKDVLNFAKRFV